MNNAMISNRGWGWITIALGALVLASLCLRLGYLPLYEPDEARYAEVSREMNETGQFLIPQLNYEPRIKKPALFQWMVAGSQRLFDSVVSFDTASRIPSIVAALFMLVGLGVAGRRLLPSLASVAVLIAVQGTMVLFWMMGRMAMVDLWMAGCVAGALLLLYGWERQRERRRLFWLAGLAMALGFNFKGPVALAVPLVVFWVYAAWQGEARNLWRAAPWVRWFLVCLCLSLPWFVAVIWRMGHEASHYFLGSELIGRFFGGGESRAQGLFYYIGVVPLVVMPWTGLLLYNLWRVWKEMRREGFRAWGQLHPLDSFLLCWGIGGALFLSLGSAKMIQYCLPLIPGLALFMVRRAEVESDRPDRSPIISKVVWGGLAILACGVFALAVGGWLKGAGLLSVYGVVLLALALCPVVFPYWRTLRAMIGMALITLVIFQGLQMALADLPNLWKTRRDFGRLAVPYLRPGLKLITHTRPPNSLLSEVRAPVIEMSPWLSIPTFAGKEPVMVLGWCSDISHFKTILGLPPFDAMGIEVVMIEADNGKYAFAFNRSYIEHFGPPDGKPLAPGQTLTKPNTNRLPD